MKFTSTGTLAVSRSRRFRKDGRRAGFTLIEALVAFSLLAAFAVSINSLMFQSRKILANGSRNVEAELLLRTLLQRSFTHGADLGARMGEQDGLYWKLDVQPASSGLFSRELQTSGVKDWNWALFQVTAEVSWGAGRKIKGETLKLAAD